MSSAISPAPCIHRIMIMHKAQQRRRPPFFDPQKKSPNGKAFIDSHLSTTWRKALGSLPLPSTPMANSEDSRRQPVHLLLVPLPAQGHLIPLLDLACHLSNRFAAAGAALSLTVLVTPANLPLLDSFFSAVPSARPLALPLPAHPSLPAGVEHVRDLPAQISTATLVRALSLLSPDVLRWARSHPHPPSAILSDFFLGWTNRLAADLAVPRLVFYSSGAFAVSIVDHVWQRMPRREDGDGPAALTVLCDLPSSPVFPFDHLPGVWRRFRAGDPDWEVMREGFLANATGSWGAAINTFDALEGPFLAHLKRAYPRVWAVGPISPAGPAVGRGGRSSIPVEEVAAWLDACPPRSVVYACFGSQYTPTEKQGRALAAALEWSGARFVWAAGGDGAVVPEGFEGRVAGRGLVVRGWAPQVQILNHGAVGAFVTHCGWNSVLEAAAAGVTLLAWPMGADQFVNARLLVEELGVAVRVGEGVEGTPEPDDLARVMVEAVAEGAWPEMRVRATELGRAAAEAVAEGGSSYRALEQMAKELSEAAYVEMK
ncbi:flavonol 3-O-glucosyltransferase UGT89B1-like [Phoenix dactylifera]|uniref:Flavonol 3-O-glucosyltransferase UGT89B1-like n=1 Tax=Phoenix dactylifera TaxID=42345 RepID=A0A8B9AXI8_PHODC|nr:flavonol 3-O-glucosyltransferase UGT89B1-like [Phoenix dactylifera]